MNFRFLINIILLFSLSVFSDEIAIIKEKISVILPPDTKIESIDANKIVIMGYCFGGLVAMDLARTGADIKGAISFHGFLTGPENSSNEIKAKVLALHGDLDPMVGQDQLDSFKEEMTKKNVDWQLHIFGGAMHSFTNPEANDPDFGAVYSKEADERSWKIFTDLLLELF